MIGKKKPTSAKKHKELRRPRRTDWEQSRRNLAAREALIDQETDEIMKTIKDGVHEK